MWKEHNYSDMVGITMLSVDNINNEELIFQSDDKRYIFYHYQDCCESVTIDDIVGNLDDLVGAPLLIARETYCKSKDEEYGSCTWTFYEFATIKGSVTVKWYDSSNGYYSESVDFRIENN